ncbi:hypothetical protein FA95DRAFT_1620919 [Auriscalpium vulgare]|uniref:Uncharacterized protein n=1 Tax=Auriscalpium vulgare TaxID=40419 RepID=A0ACB8RNP1_9AGAM|nr:hypothetical protein FA95DRAFT_1620919 [Auriscalpium vulgare]
MFGKRLASKLDSLVACAHVLSPRIPSIFTDALSVLAHRLRRKDSEERRRTKEAAAAQQKDPRKICMAEQAKWDAKKRVRTRMPDAWSRYDAGWARLAEAGTASDSESDTARSANNAPLTFKHFPWPMLDAPRRRGHITTRAVRRFVLSEHCPSSASADAVARIRDTLVRFERSYDGCIVAKDGWAVRLGVLKVRLVLWNLLSVMTQEGEGGGKCEMSVIWKQRM